MNRKVINLSSETLENIIIKNPKPTSRYTEQDPEYISEIWYLDDNRLYLPIVKTPRLKVKYTAKSWDKGSWSYCVNLCNHDIDPEISDFYKSIKAYDRHIVDCYTKSRAEWNMINVKNKYWSAARKRNKGDEDPYFSLKLISDKDGSVLTVINSNKRTSLTPKDILYGCYTDQFVSPACVIFNSKGIHPVWHVHQIVVTPQDRIFLGECLLDSITPAQTSAPIPMIYEKNMPPPPPKLSTTNNKSVASKLNLINQQDLLAALGKLKSPKPVKPTPLGERNKITPEQLVEKKEEIFSSATNKIMMESIKDLPIEGVTKN